MNVFTTDVLRGARQIFAAQPLLVDLARRSGQDEALADIHYYVDKPGLLRRTPVLLLLKRRLGHQQAPEEIVGAILLFQYKVAGIPLGMYTSNDRSGRRNVLGAAEDRVRIAACAAEHLLSRGGHVVMLSLRSNSLPLDNADERQHSRIASNMSLVMRERETADYLPLESTLDATLAKLGKKTRFNLRYYRRRAEEKLGCIFHPKLQVTEREIVAFNRDCMYPVPDSVAAWRLGALNHFERPILMGLRDASGKLLAVLAGRRLHEDTEVFWQMNRRDLHDHSLSVVMRAYFIENEVSLGMKRMYIDGGTGHSLGHAFTSGRVTDLAIVRDTAMSYLVRKVARRVIPPDNDLACLLHGDFTRSAAPVLLRAEQVHCVQRPVEVQKQVIATASSGAGAPQ